MLSAWTGRRVFVQVVVYRRSWPRASARLMANALATSDVVIGSGKVATMLAVAACALLPSWASPWCVAADKTFLAQAAPAPTIACQDAPAQATPKRPEKSSAARSGLRRLTMPPDAAGREAPLTPGQAAAVVIDDLPLVHTAQLLPVADDRGPTAAGVVIPGDAGAQVARVFARLEQVLQRAGSSSARIVKLNLYVANANVAATVREALAKHFAAAPPAVCFVETTLPVAGALVAADAVAAIGSPADASPPAAPNTPATPSTPATLPTAAAANLGAALAADGLAATTPAGPRVYVAGQAEKGDLRTATRKTLESLEATLKFLKLDWRDVAQVKSFVTPMAAVRDADDETRRFFAARHAAVPPLVWVEWQSGLPIEIELVAAAGRSEPQAVKASRPPDVEFLTPPGMTTPTIYARVTRTPAGSSIFVSGLYGAPGSSGGDQVERIFAQLRAVLATAGSDFEHLAKATYYVSDNDASTKLNELRPRYYNPKRPPAASKAQVTGVAQPGTTITLDMIAVPKPQR